MKANKKDLHESGRPLTQEEFVNKIKTDGEFAKKWGELGPVYGKQWRGWGGKKEKYQQQRSYGGSFGGPTHVEYGELVEYDVPGIDQIANLINDLKENPDSRRLMVNAWNVGELDQMVLPPCHYGFQVYTRELKPRQRTEVAQRMGITLSEGSKSSKEWDKDCDEKNIPKRAISLMWNQRSVDTFLGLPFNIASYGLLLEIIAKEVNMVPDELIGNLGDVHLYSNHIEQAKEQIGRELSLDEIKKIYIDWTLSKSCGGYAGDLKEDTIKFANQIFVEGWQNIKDPFTGKPLIELECFVLNPKRTREPYPLPKLILDDWYSTQGDPSNTTKDISEFLKNIHVSHIRIENYQSHPTIKAPLSN